MQDWDTPLDKGPPIEEPNRHRKRARKGFKPFAIETRYIGPDRTFLSFFFHRDWKMDRRYHTEKQRDQALRALIHKSKNSHAIYGQWEYRAQEIVR